MPYANNKGADQPAHGRSLISAFVVRCLDSIIPLVSISEISSLCLVCMTAQTNLSLPWSQTPKTGFLMTWLNYKRIVITCSVLCSRRIYWISEAAMLPQLHVLNENGSVSRVGTSFMNDPVDLEYDRLNER